MSTSQSRGQKKSSHTGKNRQHGESSGRGGRRPKHGQRSDARHQQNSQNKSYFEAYWNDEQIEAALEAGEAITGMVRINKMQRAQAFVHSPHLHVDVFVDGEVARNRALNDDVVVVKLNPITEWREVKSVSVMASQQDEEAKLAKRMEEMAVSELENPLWLPLIKPGADAALPVGHEQPKKDNPNGSKRWKTPKGSLADQIQSSGLQPTGVVVGIVSASESAGVTDDRLSKHVHFGTIHPMGGKNTESRLKPGQPLPSADQYIEFHPLDKRVPYMLVARNTAPFEFQSNPLGFSTPQKLFECKMTEWSERYRFPKGHLIRQVGEVGEIGPETEALLIENNVDHGEFPPDALACLERFLTGLGQQGRVEGEWQIPEEEIKKRRDLRDKCIFTIDPLTAKDLDDALHCIHVPAGKVVENGISHPEHFEVGVHIADVSYFVEMDSALDIEARRRATTVYLVQRVVPMLPPLLSEQLCSINPGVDRMAYSCIWRMTKDGNLLPNSNTWYGRTIIRSCAKLDYGLAQRLVDGDTTADDARKPYDPTKCDTSGFNDSEGWPEDRRPEVGHPAGPKVVSPEAVVEGCRNLYEIAMNRRKTRFARTGGGALALQGFKLSFKRDENGNPIGMKEYPLRNTNRLVEEYMLLANYLVAQQLIRRAGKQAFIRRHPPPDAKGMQEITERFNAAGVQVGSLNTSTAADLHAFLTGLRDGKIPLPEKIINQRREADGADASLDELRRELCDVFENLLKKPMKAAVYFLAGEDIQTNWRHWALNIPYYTHFTSPIRRYADVCVHRLLTATLDGSVKDFPQSVDELSQIAEVCNEKKEAAKAAGVASDLVFLNVYIRLEHEKQMKAKVPKPGIRAEALVEDMGDKSFTVLIPSMGVEKRIHAINEWGANRVRVLEEIAAPTHSDSASDDKAKKKKNSKKDDDKNKGKVTALELVWKLANKKERKVVVRMLSTFQVRLVPKKNSPTLDFECLLL